MIRDVNISTFSELLADQATESQKLSYCRNENRLF